MSESRKAFRNVVTVISVAILVGVEIMALALLGGWAIAGLFEWGDTVSYVLMAIFGALGGYAIYIFTRNALQIEPEADAR